MCNILSYLALFLNKYLPGINELGIIFKFKELVEASHPDVGASYGTPCSSNTQRSHSL